MGQLKFRVWCINKCEWETDRILIGFDGTLYHQSKQMYMRPVNPETHIVEQFTGLLDKNGVEIYEGDDVVYIGVFYTIRWSLKTSSWFLEAKSYDKDDLWFHKPLTSVVITGNVHESKP